MLKKGAAGFSAKCTKTRGSLRARYLVVVVLNLVLKALGPPQVDHLLRHMPPNTMRRRCLSCVAINMEYSVLGPKDLQAFVARAKRVPHKHSPCMRWPGNLTFLILWKQGRTCPMMCPRCSSSAKSRRRQCPANRPHVCQALRARTALEALQV